MTLGRPAKHKPTGVTGKHPSTVQVPPADPPRQGRGRLRLLPRGGGDRDGERTGQEKGVGVRPGDSDCVVTLVL